jgi:hypothetical protein
VCKLLFLVVAGVVLLRAVSLGEGTASAPQRTGASKLTLSFVQVAREGREGRTTPKLLVEHADLGPVCELQCYETGPFQTGDAVKKEDGSVVFSYESGNMTCTTTCTTVGDDRVQALTEVQGLTDDLKKVPYLGACLQFQRSQLFTRQGPLQEFAKRSLLYTMRGPVMGLDTARGKMTNFTPDAPENNPPMVQWYVPIDRMHPGDIWGVVGTAGDRPLYGLVACTSRDGKWVTGYGAQYNRTIGQLYMPCIHVVPDVQMHVDLKTGTVRYREMIYVMPNDPQKLLQAFREDFPPAKAFETSPTPTGALLLKPAAEGVPALELKLDLTGGGPAREYSSRLPEGWKPTWWGTFIRSGDSWRAWAHPHGEALDLCVSFKAGSWKPDAARAVATLTGQGWTSAAAPEGTAAQVLRSADGKWTALLFWERADAGKPAAGVPAADQPDADVISVRGRILLGETASLDPAQRKGWADTDWEHAKPYRMPVADPVP